MDLNKFRDVDLVIDKANANFMQRQFVSQGDLKGRTLTVQITDRGVVGEVPGLTLNLRWHNVDSGLTDLSAFECIDQANSLFRIEYPKNMLTPGKVLANIQIIDGEKVTHLKTFEITVQRLSGEMVGVTGQAEYGALVAVLADANKFRTDIDKLGNDKADKTALAETDAEVAVARDVFNTLDERLTTKEQEVTAQLAQTDGAVNAVNLRVDNLVIPLSPENTNIEVTDAHNSIVKNKNFSSLKERLEESEGELVQYRLDYATLESNIDVIVPNIKIKDFMRGTILTPGKYIVPDTGVMGNNSTYSSSDFIEIAPSVAYKLYIEKQCYGAWYDSDNIFISGLSSNTTGALTLDIVSPVNAKYIRISGHTAEINKFTLKIKDTDALFLNPLINVSDSQILKSSTVKVLKVKPLGGGDFTTLRSAFESITDSSPTNKYVVEFYGDGTEYNLSDEYTPTERTSSNGLLLPEHTKLVGIGGTEKCIIACRLTADESNRYFSTINLRATSELEGITFIGEYTRNVLHDDFGTLENTNKKIKNCHFIGSNLNLNYVAANGVLSGAEVVYENCVFECLTTSEYPYACHNNINFTEPAKLHFKNCRFKYLGSTLSVKLGSLNTNANGIVCIATFEGCKIPVQLRLSEENVGAYGAGILWKVNGYGNHIDDVKVLATDGVDYSDRIDFI